MRNTIAVIGRGELADIVGRNLSGTYRIVRRTDIRFGVPKSAKLCVVLSEDYRSSTVQSMAEEMGRTGVPWLAGMIVDDEGIVGPFVRPGGRGCALCAERRRLSAEHERQKSLELQWRLWRSGVIERGRGASRWGLAQMSRLIDAEVGWILAQGTARTENRVYLLDLATLTASLHAFLPDPLCPICGGLPADSAESASLVMQSSPKAGTGSYRGRSLEQLSEVLASDYLDERTGLLNAADQDIRSPFSDVLAALPSLGSGERTAGRSHSYKTSLQIAMLEGLERYCGGTRRSKRSAVFEAYREVADRALDPLSVGVYSPEQYALPDFPYRPFDPETPIPWVWGYSLTRERPLLVPEQIAYYGTGFAGEYVSEGSNGCSLGGSMAEAILHGIMEVVERDAFLLTWYARLPIPRLDPDSAGDAELSLMIARLRFVAGFDAFLFNSTQENGIPSIWAVAKNRNRAGANLICAAGAHPDPVRAAKSALFEIAGQAKVLDELYASHGGDFERMLHDPYLVAEMPDHCCLYTVPQAEERLGFLLGSSAPSASFAEAFQPWGPHADLKDDVGEAVDRFRRLNMDVVVVDQTTDEIAKNGLHCVKVIIPGMLPMSFGHHLKRLAGLERVLKVPHELGYADRWLTEDELNPYPHPFV